MRKILIGFVVCLFSYGSASAADPDFFAILNSIPDGTPERTGIGRIQEIDLGNRSIVVSGFKYLLGPSTLADAVEVRMLGVEYGSVEMLQVNMFVEVTFVPAPEYRIAKELQHIEAQEEF